GSQAHSSGEEEVVSDGESGFFQDEEEAVEKPVVKKGEPTPCPIRPASGLSMSSGGLHWSSVCLSFTSLLVLAHMAMDGTVPLYSLSTFSLPFVSLFSTCLHWFVFPQQRKYHELLTSPRSLVNVLQVCPPPRSHLNITKPTSLRSSTFITVSRSLLFTLPYHHFSLLFSLSL